jgi:hypothetical protein
VSGRDRRSAHARRNAHAAIPTDRPALGLPDGSRRGLGARQAVELGWAAIRSGATGTIAGDK